MPGSNHVDIEVDVEVDIGVDVDVDVDEERWLSFCTKSPLHRVPPASYPCPLSAASSNTQYSVLSSSTEYQQQYSAAALSTLRNAEIAKLGR